tara:strand:- start:210 stop:419 length:210 start_codon:yes stop_codon:yes gene_type:complete
MLEGLCISRTDELPLSWNTPERELQPGPPLSQITISLFAAGFFDGKNQNKRLFALAFAAVGGPIGKEPA